MRQQSHFETFGFILKMLEGTSLPGLAFQRIELPPHFNDDVFHPQKILMGGIELAERLSLLFFVTDDAGSLLD